MIGFTTSCKALAVLFNTTLLVLTLGLSIIPKANADTLYIGDISDNTVKRFDATTGQYIGVFIESNPKDLSGGLDGGFAGPRGLIFDKSGKLNLVNQNVGLPFNGAVLEFNSKTRVFLKAIIPPTDTNAPFAPRGMILWNSKVLFVADMGDSGVAGKLLTYTKNGKFLAELKPDPSLLPPGQFHPRGVVIGPDGFLYVSNFPNLATGLGGQVLRFNPETGQFVDVFISDVGGPGRLNRPEGLVFGPDGRLYITSFRADPNDIDAIRIYNPNGGFADKIDLYQITTPSTRVFAQALLFGPDGFLFVPLSGGGGPDTGAVRRYNVTDKTFVNFVPPPPIGSLGAPWYLTFGDTDPGTLAYKSN